MKILFICDNFPPEVNAPAWRTYEHSRVWVESGYDVTVITCAPNFPKGVVFDGYKNSWKSVEYVDGIRVVRVKSLIAKNDGFLIRTLDYVSFMFSATFFSLFERRPDVVVGTSPQFFAAVGAWLVSVLRRRPFVFEVRDLWPASIVTVGAMKPGLTIRTLERLEMFLYRRARLIIPVTNSFKDEMVARGIPAEKIRVVRNGVDAAKFSPRERSDGLAASLGVSGKFVVAYLGTHGLAHALEGVLAAAEQLRCEEDIVILLVGDGARKQKVVAEAQSRGLANVRFSDPLPKEKMPELWSVCDIALVTLKDDPVFATVIPSKIFEAFGMGKPILLSLPQGEASELVDSERAGICVPPENPEALANAILSLKRDPQSFAEYAEASASAAAKYSRNHLAKKMGGYIHDCL